MFNKQVADEVAGHHTSAAMSKQNGFIHRSIGFGKYKKNE
jgi:hypothetical protein